MPSLLVGHEEELSAWYELRGNDAVGGAMGPNVTDEGGPWRSSEMCSITASFNHLHCLNK
jgi:hypothetical protein